MTRGGKILYLPLGLVQPGSSQRRKATITLQELAASIAQVGILQPLTVRPSGGRYVVVSGNRRLLAARMAGLDLVPCILLDLKEPDAMLISLTENLQREDLNYFAQAELFSKYLALSGLTQQQAAARLGRSQSAVANLLRLLTHSEPVRRAILDAELTQRQARELLRISQESLKLRIIPEIQGLSVAQTQRYIDQCLENGHCALPERLRRRDARLFLERVAQDAAQYQAAGLTADLARQPGRELVLTVSLPPVSR
jgi:ParB family chromosome partitioning protein